MIVLAAIGYQNGNPSRLVYGSDYMGRVCGEGNKTNSSYLVYPRPQEDVAIAGFQLATSSPWDISFYSICVQKCPKLDEVVCDDLGNSIIEAQMALTGKNFSKIAHDCLDYPIYNPFTCLDSRVRTNCWNTLFTTKPILFRCFPEYTFKVELMPESGCVAYQYYTNPVSNVTTSTCSKYRQVTKRTTEQPTGTDVLFNSFNTVSQVFARNVADVQKAWPVILVAGLVVSSSVGLIYIISLWCFVGIIVWGSVLGVQLMSVVFTLYLYIKGGVITVAFIEAAQSQVNGVIVDVTSQVSTVTGVDLINAPAGNSSGFVIPLINGTALTAGFSSSANYQKQFVSAAYVMTAVTIMLFFLILLLARRIARAIEIFREASSAIRATPSLILIPFISVPCMLALIVWWGGATLYLASSGSYHLSYVNYSTPINPDTTVFTSSTFGAFSYSNVFIAYQFLGFLWTSNVISAVVTYWIAGTVGHWYWKGDEETLKTKCSSSPMMRSLYIVFRFHMGSVAFGALLVAIVQFIRYVAAYLDQRSKSVTKRNVFMRAIMCCVHCCLLCLTWCVKFISRNAFIMSALYAHGFCESARLAFMTITNNLAQVALVTFLGDLILRFGQILITLISAFSCWVWLDSHREYGFGGSMELNTFWFPTLLSGALGWFIANEALSIYDITVDTLLLSFCQDHKLKQVGKESRHELKTSASLRHFIDRTKKNEMNKVEKEYGGDRRLSARGPE